ncbi:hypothetical protein FSP39_021639 [Pinctada imbricata]|uniref:Novel STAND NTPase 3 domain-containing protein n=1 Tax=Pinctada imbricata TaxID=66713 RepID=A0AA88YN76_PINIB|nr:hypothetical protein FSP39_021639 [Pinctada imbricata]
MLDAHKRELSSTNSTRAEEAATKMLLEKSFVVITGKAGTGKTYTAKNILVKLRKVRKGIPIILTHSDEWRQVDPIARNIILLDDVFGSNNLEIMKLSDWEIHFDSLYECCKNGKMYLIISCRDTILANIEQKLQKYKLFNSQSFRDNIINLSSQEYALTAAEKTDILMHFCRKYDVQVIEEDVTSRSGGLNLEERFSRVLTSKSISRISQTNPFIGFPQTCFLFFNDERFFRKGVEYFVRANLHLKDTISEMKRGNPQEGLVLFYTFLEKYSELDCSHINSEQFEKLKQDLDVEMEVTDIQEYASSLCPAYLTKINGDADRFTFQHATIFEAVMQAFGRDYQSTFLKLAGEKLIWDFATSSNYSQKSEEIVLKIRREHAQELADHLLKHSYWYHHKTMEDEEFAVVVLEKLLSTDDLSPREILKRCSCNEAYHIVRELIKRFHTHSGELNGIPKLEPRHLSHDDLQHALKWAIWKGSAKCIDALATEGQLDLHKDILYEDNVYMTPLTYAGRHDTSGKSVEFLLDKYNVSCDSRDANANTIAHRAAQFGWNKIMKRIISEHSSELSKKNKRQLLPIEVACFYGQSEVLDLLLTNNACPLEPHILMKWTLFGLRFCPLYPSQDVYLDEVGEIKLSEELSSTTEGMFKETFEILEAKYPRCFQSNIMNTVDAFGNTALHYCVLNNLFSLFSFIIQRSSSAVRDKDCLQKVIRICTYLGRVEMLRILSKHSKIDETVNGILGFCSEIDLIRKENLLKCLKTYDANEQTVFDNPQLENEIRNMLKKHK